MDRTGGRPRSADASGPGAVLRLHPLSSGEPWGSGKGSYRSVSILWACCPGVLDFGDQGRGKGIFFRKELGMGVCQGKGLFQGEPRMEEEGSAFSLPSWGGELSAQVGQPSPSPSRRALGYFQKWPRPDRNGARKGTWSPRRRGKGHSAWPRVGLYPPCGWREGYSCLGDGGSLGVGGNEGVQTESETAHIQELLPVSRVHRADLGCSPAEQRKMGWAGEQVWVKGTSVRQVGGCAEGLGLQGRNGKALARCNQGKLPWKGHPLRSTNWKINLK